MRDAQSKRNNEGKLGTTDWKARSLYGWLLVRQNFHSQSSFTPHNYASSLILFHNGHITKFTTAQNDEISSQLTRVEHMSNISVSSSFRSHEKDSTTSHSLNSLIQKSSSNYNQPNAHIKIIQFSSLLSLLHTHLIHKAFCSTPLATANAAISTVFIIEVVASSLAVAISCDSDRADSSVQYCALESG